MHFSAAGRVHAVSRETQCRVHACGAGFHHATNILLFKSLYLSYIGAMRTGRPLSRSTVEAARLLGRRIALARRERRWTVAELAERVGCSATTMGKVERGDPSVALGTVFEAAALVGVALFTDDTAALARESELVEARLAVLPQRVRRHHVDDDF